MMAKIGDLSVNIGIEVSDETVQRCCQLLQMYFEDNPDKTIVLDWYESAYDRTKLYPTVYIKNSEEKDGTNQRRSN